jgi:hypothetical protein
VLEQLVLYASAAQRIGTWAVANLRQKHQQDTSASQRGLRSSHRLTPIALKAWPMAVAHPGETARGVMDTVEHQHDRETTRHRS